MANFYGIPPCFNVFMFKPYIMSRPKPHQIPQFERQKRNIFNCVFAFKRLYFVPDMEATEGTFYSERFKKIRELKSLSELTGLKYDY